jgi:predicted metal-dependent hydrolase
MLGLLGNKKIAQLILSEVPKMEVETEVPKGLESDFSKAHEALASEIISAVKGEDSLKLSRSLKQFVKLCEKEEEYSEEGD